jgi:multiple sugar transport system substrate-binding protein
MEMPARKVSRRDFLKVAGFAGAGLALVGCQSTPAPTATQAPAAPESEATEAPAASVDEATEAPAAQPAAAEPVELNLTLLDYFDSTKPVIEDDILGALKESHPEITVKINYSAWNRYNEELTTAFAGGVTPDVMAGGAVYVPQFGKRDWVLPLDDYIATAADWDWEDFVSGAREDALYNDKIVAVPYRLDVRTLWYRKSYLQEAGYDNPPTDWDELREVAKATTLRDGDKITRAGFTNPPLSNNWQNDFQPYMAFLAAADGKLLSDDLQHCLIAEDAGIQTAELFRQLFLVDKVSPYPTYDNQGDLNAIHFNKDAMVYSNDGIETVAISQAADVLPDLYAALPLRGKTHLWINKYMVSKLTKAPDASWLLLSHLTSKSSLEAYAASMRSVTPRASLANADYLSDNMKVLAQASQVASVFPKYYRLVEIFRPIAAALEAIYRGEKGTEEALKEAVEAVDKILAEG